MTLAQLAKKHHLDPESAKAFLKEWLDSQEIEAIKDRYGNVISADVSMWDTDTALIARSTDLGE